MTHSVTSGHPDGMTPLPQWELHVPDEDTYRGTVGIESADGTELPLTELAPSDAHTWRAKCLHCQWTGDLTFRMYGEHPYYPGRDTCDALHDDWTRHIYGVSAKAQVVDSLATTHALRTRIEQAQANINNGVQRLRADGASWGVIADLAGITRQAAWERWGDTPAAHRKRRGF